MFIMVKLPFIILVSFSISNRIAFGGNICSHYDDEDCLHPNTLKNGHFVNLWSVYLPGVTKGQARQLLEDIGFDYLGQIMDGVDLHLVTKKGTPEKHAMLNKEVMELLKKHEKIHSVYQKHVIQNSPDEMYNILDGNKVYFQSLDPDTIKLNDGAENLRRLRTREKSEANTSFSTRPISSNYQSYKPNDGDVSMSANKVQPELTNENLSDDHFTFENFSNENLPNDKTGYPSGEYLSDEDIISN